MSHWANIVVEDVINASSFSSGTIAALNRVAQIVTTSDKYHFRTIELETLADEISVCTDINELCTLLWNATTTIGLQNFSLYSLKQGRSRGFHPRLCTSHTENWLETYQRKSLQSIDPVFHRLSTTDGSFLFSDLDRSCPLTIDYWKERDEQGVGQFGFGYATTRPSGARFAMDFSIGNNEEKSREILEINRNDLQVISQLAIECFCYVHSSDESTGPCLDDVELRFLYYLATQPRIDKAMLQTPKYGGNKALQQSIKQKLNVETIFQAVSLASVCGWFDSLPISADEAIRPFPGLVGWNIDDD